jgi:tRNA(Ile)-lysidine synthase TilS/MesJ
LRQSKAFGPIRDSDVKDDLIIAFSSGCDSLAAVAQAQTLNLYDFILIKKELNAAGFFVRKIIKT